MPRKGHRVAQRGKRKKGEPILKGIKELARVSIGAEDFRRLHQVFNGGRTMATDQDQRIDQWLVAQIAVRGLAESFSEE